VYVFEKHGSEYGSAFFQLLFPHSTNFDRLIYRINEVLEKTPKDMPALHKLLVLERDTIVNRQKAHKSCKKETNRVESEREPNRDYDQDTDMAGSTMKVSLGVPLVESQHVMVATMLSSISGQGKQDSLSMESPSKVSLLDDIQTLKKSAARHPNFDLENSVFKVSKFPNEAEFVLMFDAEMSRIRFSDFINPASQVPSIKELLLKKFYLPLLYVFLRCQGKSTMYPYISYIEFLQFLKAVPRRRCIPD
jgi:hypothetical protein